MGTYTDVCTHCIGVSMAQRTKSLLLWLSVIAWIWIVALCISLKSWMLFHFSWLFCLVSVIIAVPASLLIFVFWAVSPTGNVSLHFVLLLFLTFLNTSFKLSSFTGTSFHSLNRPWTRPVRPLLLFLCLFP